MIDKKAERIIQELRNQKNGQKFSELFDKGTLDSCKSQSEADAALCAVVAFRAGEDAALIDTVFRKSALYRPKWDRDDYREKTIRKGIEAAQRRKTKKKEIPSFIKRTKVSWFLQGEKANSRAEAGKVYNKPRTSCAIQ